MIIRGIAIWCVALAFAAGAESRIASIVVDRNAGPAARHGVEALRGALAAKGWRVQEAQSAARARGSIVVMTKVGQGGTAPPEPESLAIHHSTWRSKPALDVAGSDDRGLMYALLDAADRVGWAKE